METLLPAKMLFCLRSQISNKSAFSVSHNKLSTTFLKKLFIAVFQHGSTGVRVKKGIWFDEWCSSVPTISATNIFVKSFYFFPPPSSDSASMAPQCRCGASLVYPDVCKSFKIKKLGITVVKIMIFVKYKIGKHFIFP